MYLRTPYFFEQPSHTFLEGSGEISVSVNFNIRDQKLFFARGSGKEMRGALRVGLNDETVVYIF